MTLRNLQGTSGAARQLQFNAIVEGADEGDPKDSTDNSIELAKLFVNHPGYAMYEHHLTSASVGSCLVVRRHGCIDSDKFHGKYHLAVVQKTIGNKENALVFYHCFFYDKCIEDEVFKRNELFPIMIVQSSDVRGLLLSGTSSSDMMTVYIRNFDTLPLNIFM